MLYIIKFVLTAIIIVAITEIVKLKQLGYMAGLIAALPTVSVLSMIWMYAEQKDNAPIAASRWTFSGLSCRRCRSSC